MQSQVRVNRVPEKVPEKVGEALVQRQVNRILGEASGEGSRRRLRDAFNRVPEKVQVRFNRVPKKVPEKVPGGFGAEPGQVSTGFRGRFRRRSGLVQVNTEKVPEKVPGGFGAEPEPGEVQEGSGEGLGGFGAEPAQVQQGSRKTWCKAKSGSTGSGEGSEGLGGFGAEPGQVQQVWRRVQRRSGRLWCRARSGSTCLEKVPEKVWEALVQSQVRFNRVPEKVPEKVAEAKPVQVHSTHGKSTEVSSAWLPSTAVKKIKRCGCWGYH